MNKKKVLVSVVGRYHAFDLAKQFQNNDFLYKLNTTYPKFIASRWGIANNKICSNILLEFFSRYVKRIFPQSFRKKITEFVSKSHAKSNIKYLKDIDVFIGWRGSSLEALIAAKKLNVITIVEGGSSHYNHQMKILIEENRKFNIDFIPDYTTWQRELLEYELADYISIPSSFVKRTFIENGVPENKLLVNPYGVDLSSFITEEKTDGTFRVVFSGNLSITKGAYYLLKAFYELDLPNSELWHLGSINDDVIPLIKDFEKNNIKYLGHKPQDELYKYYSQCSVFVLMSVQDGFGMVLTQAMACSLPLICTTNTGGYDVISEEGKEGFIIPIRDVEMLKQKLLFLYNNPEEAKKMGINARLKVSNGFTWDDYGERYLKNLNVIG